MAVRPSHRFSRLLWALVALLTPQAARAVTVLNTAGFEGYTLGALVPANPPSTPQLGQNGWVGIDQMGQTANVQNATIQSTIAQSGSKALKVTRAAGIDNYWSVLFDPNPAMQFVTLPANRVTLPSNRYLLVDWDMRVANAFGDSLNGELGPYFGVQTFDASSGIAASIASLGVDATTGEVVYQEAGTGFFKNTGSVVSFDAWNHFSLLLDYSLHQYTMSINGAALSTKGFIDGALNNFTDADISAIGIFDSPESVAIQGTAFFDNFRVIDAAGDFSSDGDADAGDLPLWRSAYHATAVGDADRDGDSDGQDFLAWQRNLGIDVTPVLPVSNAVPEPSGCLLTAVSALVLGARGKSRR